MMLRRVGCGLALAAAGVLALSLGCSSSGGEESEAAAAPLPMLASYDRSCALDSDCVVVSEPACAPCGKAALAAKEAARYSTALGEAQKTATCQRQIERSAPCSVEGAVVPRCSSAMCGLAAAPFDAGADAGGDASPE